MTTELEQRAILLEKRLREISNELLRTPLRFESGPSLPTELTRESVDSGPPQPLDWEHQSHLTLLQAEHDALTAELKTVRSCLASQAPAVPIKLPPLVRAAIQPPFPRDVA